MVKKKKSSAKKGKEIKPENISTLQLKSETDIAMDFATKVYKKFNKIVKSIILFGSVAKQNAQTGSDIDIIIVIDDASIKWDTELISWYREELDKIISSNPYEKELHINTIKLSTWWEDLMRGDPILLNILRYGDALIDFAGFFVPIKYLLINGKIKSTPEAIYSCINRVPQHIARSKMAELGSIEGLYWAMVDSAHGALMAKGITPASPEHISVDLKQVFVDSGMLKQKYVDWYKDLLLVHKRISHGQARDIKGMDIDLWQKRSEEFYAVMLDLVKKIIEK
jgi:predicted nucleotidyltransferase/uncharacterized protein (UPF0332 family)